QHDAEPKENVERRAGRRVDAAEQRHASERARASHRVARCRPRARAVRQQHGPSIRAMGQTPTVVAAYIVLALTLGGQWIAAMFATLIHERLTSRKLLGFVIASVGAALVIVGGQQGAADASAMRLRGDLLELGAATAWAASLTIGAIVLRKEPVLGYVTLMVLIGTALLLPLGVLAQAYRDVPSWSSDTWLAAGF